MANITDLTTAQKEVLAKVAQAPTPTVALSEISEGRKLVTARDILDKLGLIEYDENEANITDEGWELMIDLNLADATGELTDEGQSYANENDEEAEVGPEEEMPTESAHSSLLQMIDEQAKAEPDDLF